MIASHRADEITFYEELGVAPGASPEEIRDAFRSLVRLLHPDQQTDSQLKEIAEKQMRKLNRIYAVLSDPDRRREYDDQLEEDYGPALAASPAFRPAIVKMMVRAAWAGAITVSAVLLIWLASDNAPGPLASANEQIVPVASSMSVSVPKPVTHLDQSPLIASLRSDLKAVTLERDAAIRELLRLRGSEPAAKPENTSRPETRPEVVESRAPAITMTELPSAARLPIFSSAGTPRIENPPVKKLAGFWFYAKPSLGPRNKNQALYPPQFIEVTINEESGVIYGRYRARFEVADRPISPDVNFTFTGPSSPASQSSFPWTGSGGAKGDLTLKFISENSVKVDWKATEMGTQLGLDGGTAVLTRRIE
jgi:curved DNA-binding protein CbpA